MTHHIAILDDPPVFGRSTVSRAAVLEWAKGMDTPGLPSVGWHPEDFFGLCFPKRKKARIAPKPRHQLLAPVAAATLCTPT